MAKSTKRKSSRPAVPLTRHPRGYWCKKVRGKIHYFGRIVGDEDGQKALNLWLEQRDDLLAGRTPRSTGDSGPTMADVCNRFLTFKQGLLDSGELAKRTFERYHATCSRMVEHFGRTRLVADLRPETSNGSVKPWRHSGDRLLSATRSRPCAASSATPSTPRYSTSRFGLDRASGNRALRRYASTRQERPPHVRGGWDPRTTRQRQRQRQGHGSVGRQRSTREH